MKFIEALKAMKDGQKVKLPSWGGYWVYDPDGDKIWMHCRNGDLKEIRETDRLSYTLENICSEEWMIADETNTPLLGGTATFGFGKAIEYVKRGLRVARQNWNGKDQFVFLAHCDAMSTDADMSAYQEKGVGVCEMLVIKTAQDVLQPGWLASQSDMLSEDWYIVD